VQAYRLLVATMKADGMNYPLHLGVTEAGDGEDGRIKSAIGIGALLEDGLGDTIRVSLTEAPEAEIPVAQLLLKKFDDQSNVYVIDKQSNTLNYDPYSYERRVSHAVSKVGGHQVPVVVADLSAIDAIKPSHFFGFGYNYSVPLDKWHITDSAADIVYIGNQILSFEMPGTLMVACSYQNWDKTYRGKSGCLPLVSKEELLTLTSTEMCLVSHQAEDDDTAYLKNYPNAIVVVETQYSNKTQLIRAIRMNFADNEIKNPIILRTNVITRDPETFQLWSSSDLGANLIDGFGDGVWLQGTVPMGLINSTSFGILQATRTRISKTEYISCPSCGRTLFDLQETTAKIRARTSHLKGLKIGIMGCIVNGPGEMADADYGYVGTRPGKIHLYKEKTVVRKNVDESEAVDALIELIRENGDWIDPVVH
jgi:(E)-4-hydroxy-3-methylbut-2-enyl-diphosphate synthase